MAVPHESSNFGDLLDPRFQRIFDEEYAQIPSRREMLYTDVPSNGRNNMQWSGVGTLGDFTEFTGTVGYQSQSQGYDTTATYLEFSNGVQVERKLFDDDQYNVMDQRPRALAASAGRTRERHAAQLLNKAFSVDTQFYNNSEAVALCTNSHTTNSGASTASGFDNLVTSSMTATAVAAARIQMVGYRGDQAERISVVPNQLWYPPDLYEKAFEIISAAGKVDTADNNPNVHQGQYTGIEWNYLTDTNNWFVVDETQKRNMVFWVDRVALEFGMVEDFDTFIAKWRAYMRYAFSWTDWRWILGAQVS